MRLNHKSIAIFVIVLCMPLSTITSMTACKQKAVDFIIWLEVPEKQVIVDEIISSLEDIGLNVNAMYLTWEEWFEYPGHYDLSYGGLSYTFFIDDIFNLAFLNYLINSHMFKHHDVKYEKLVTNLWDMYNAAVADPTIVTEEYMTDMADIFQDTEKRLWKKKYVMPFVQWEGFFPPYGMDILFTEAIVPVCLKGEVFANQHLRRALYNNIDRNVFLDYHATYNPYLTYEVYHLFQLSIHHDTSLPNY